MGLKVTFELSNEDLRHFKAAMRRASDRAAAHGRQRVLTDAKALLQEMDETTNVPQFVAVRMARLTQMIRMLEDSQWSLPAPESKRVLSALAYLTNPHDLIPDQVPGLGYLDDAIMAELIGRELSHELEAYRRFTAYLGRLDSTPSPVQLASKRSALQQKMRQCSTDADIDNRQDAPRLTIF